jgi:Zn-dependent protease/CBS domain-containing protein
MRETVRIGNVAGVAVGLNWSVLVIFLLITVGLAAGRFPLLFPELEPQAYALAGLVAGLIFFASLLAHELGHAVVARRNGIDVEGITLWLFGGVARLEGEPADAGADFRIAGIGPLISLVLSGVFFVAGSALAAAGVPPIAVDVFAWLALINLVLAIFNLVPAAPLDGGRLLRALLWNRHGDRMRAAAAAARAGRGFGWFLVAAGLATFLFLPGIGGLWLALIGWFLTAAAGAEEQHARTRNALADVRVGDVMSADPVTAPASITVDEFLDRFVFPNRFSAFPLVTDGGRAVGLVTLNRAKQVPSDERDRIAVSDVACSLDDVPVFHRDEPLAEVLTRMNECADGRALVTEDGRVVGIVSPTDVMRQLEHAELRSPRRDARV